MALNSRSKGQRGEREIVKFFIACFEAAGRDDLATGECGRNLQQWAAGGADLLGVPYLSCEIKLGAKKNINPMRNAGWLQCQDQARRRGEFPVLFWRADHSAWNVRSWVWLSLNGTGMWVAADYDINSFASWYIRLIKK